MFGWLILVVLIVLALQAEEYATWFWIGAAATGYWKVGRLWYLYGTPWRRVHFPFLRHYAAAVGARGGLSGSNSLSDQDVREAIADALRASGNAEPLQQFITDALQEGYDFKDRGLLRDYLKQRFTEAGAVDRALEKFAELFREPDNGIKVRLVIAKLVEERYGQRAKGSYLAALCEGKAP